MGNRGPLPHDLPASEFSGQQKAGAVAPSCSDPKRNTTKPCNLTRLAVGDGTSDKHVQCVVPMTRNTPDPTAPKDIKAQLKNHDLVLEVLADADTGGAVPPQKPAKITIMYGYEGSCPNKQHWLVTCTGKGRSTDNRRWVAKPPETFNVVSRMFPPGARWLAPYWRFGGEKELVVAAESCGVSGRNRPVPKLTCLVRVYDSSVFAISLKIPSFKRWTYGYKAQANLGAGASERSSTFTRMSSGDVTSQTKEGRIRDTRKGDDYKTFSVTEKEGEKTHTLSDQWGTKKNQVFLEEGHATTYSPSGPFSGVVRETWKLDRKDSTETGRTAPPTTEFTFRPALSLKRNGAELNVTQIINTVISSATDFHEKVYKPFYEIKNWVPQVGFSFDIDASVLEGTITGTWGNRHAAKAPSGGRWVAVESYFALTVDLLVLGLDFKLSFGIQIVSPGVLDLLAAEKAYEVILAIKLNLRLDAGVRATLAESSASTKTPSPPVISANATPELFAHGKCSLLGYTFIEVKTGVTGKVSFEGKLLASLKAMPRIEGEAKRAETRVYGYYMSKAKGRTELFNQLIYPGGTLWKGTAP